jgi:MEMO1 family protein
MSFRKRSVFRVVSSGAIAVLLLQCATEGHGGVRDPILAGSWYPADAKDLRRAVESYLDGDGSRTGVGGETSGTDAASRGSPIALIVPHAGYRYSGPTAGKGYATARGVSYDRVIVIGPSHRVAFEGAALPEDEAWRTPLGDVPLDRTAIAALEKRTGFASLPAAHAQEHCLEIQVPFLQVALAPGFKLVPIVIGRLDQDGCGEIAEGLAPLLGPRTLLVVSSDFTHFGPSYDYVPFRENVPERLREMDEGAAAAIQAISPTDFEAFCARTGDTICGREPIRVLLTLLEGGKARVEKLGYARSGDLMGDFTNSVSYYAFAFLPPAGEGGGGSKGQESSGQPGPGPEGSQAPRAPNGPPAPRMLDEKEGAFLLRLARGTVSAALRKEKAPSTEVPSEFPKDSPLREVRGVFVTLTEDEDLRGCIGSIVGVEPLAKGVAHQAMNSAFHDPRFPALRPEEIDRVSIEISVLTPPVPVQGYEAIEVGRHGVLIEKRGYRAVFLPQVATEQGWDRDTMLSHLCRKAGLGPEEWRSGMSFEVFEAQILEEKHER